jgi:hypothetical protein
VLIVEMINKVWQHLEVDCRFKLEATALEARLQVYPCGLPHIKLRSLICLNHHINSFVSTPL